jgi:hypothetical protein
LTTSIFRSCFFSQSFIATRYHCCRRGGSRGSWYHSSPSLPRLAILPPRVWISGIAPDGSPRDDSSWPTTISMVSKAIRFSNLAWRPTCRQVIMYMRTLRRPLLTCFSRNCHILATSIFCRT